MFVNILITDDMVPLVHYGIVGVMLTSVNFFFSKDWRTKWSPYHATDTGGMAMLSTFQLQMTLYQYMKSSIVMLTYVQT